MPTPVIVLAVLAGSVVAAALIAIFCCCVLPYDYVRLRRTGGLYLIGFVIYLLTHNLRWWALGQ